MKSALFYYSGSGNTRLVCHYIKNRITQTVWDLYDIRKTGPVDLSPYSLVGFAASTYYFGIPPLMRRFISRMREEKKKPAFLFNTFGMMPGRTLKVLKRAAQDRGFRIVLGFSLHTPENYPPLIARGWGNEEAPSEKELLQFSSFLSDLKKTIVLIREGKTPPLQKIKTGLWASLLPAGSRRMAVNAVRGITADRTLCRKCGICVSSCGTNAVRLDPFPVFNPGLCEGCWNCFNRCPEKAIHTDKVSAQYQYREPSGAFKNKFRN